MSTDHPGETTPLRSAEEEGGKDVENGGTQNDVAPIPNANANPCKLVMLGLLKAFESTLEWSPFVAVMSMQSTYPPVIALGTGALVVFIIILYSLMKKIIIGSMNKSDEAATVSSIISEFRPKTLDLGQFVLFGSLAVLSFLLQYVSAVHAAELLVLWFNPITTG